jgi:hypothetical protein
MDRECSRLGIVQKCKKKKIIWQEHLKERDMLEYLGVNGSIIF